MKKFIYSMFALAIAAMTFSSCEDVPMPYNDPNSNPGGGDADVLLDEKLTSKFGTFEVVTVEGYDWTISHSCAVGTGYVNKVNQVSKSYMISPELDFTDVTEAFLQFDYALGYAQNGGNDKVLITDNYTGDPETTTWDDMSIAWVGSTDWTFYTYQKAIAEKFMGKKKVRIAFYYDAPINNSKTWEIKNVLVKKGTPEEPSPDEPVGPDVPDGTYVYEPFSTDFGSFTSHTITGQQWIIDYKTAKATGYVNKTNVASEAYLVSPALDLSNSSGAYIKFEHILAYATNEGADKVLVTTNFVEGHPESTEWIDMTTELKPANSTSSGGIDWNTFNVYEMDLPASVIGNSNVRVALYYSSTSAGSRTWEVRNLYVIEGSCGNTPQEPEPEATTGSEDMPITVAQALKLEPSDQVWVWGHIVGCVKDDVPYFGEDVLTNATNLNVLVADMPTTTNYDECLVVQLPRGALRNALNLQTNASMLQQQVLFCGKLQPNSAGHATINPLVYARHGTDEWGTKPTE